jgi:benzoylformate decarboxylase
MAISGIQAFLNMLSDAGVRYIFGNPGTTELPLNDALVDEHRLSYILGLQEVPVMAMADGYAMASGKLGVVNLHISCGLGNAMGMLYNAFREGTPLLVTAGQQDRRLKFSEPILWGDMVQVARPWTKWAVEVERIEDLPSAIRRAVQLALTPPTGPVFLSLPVDIQMATAELNLTGPNPVDRRVRPPMAALQQACAALLDSQNPVILAGSRVVEAGAVEPLVAVAEQLGAVVMSESGHTHGRQGFPADHPLYGQTIPHWSPQIRERLAPHDALLVVGMDLLREYVYHAPEPAVPEHLHVVHIDADASQLGKNFPIDVGVWGDVRESLTELKELLAARMSDEQIRRAAQRSARHGAAQQAQRRQLQERIAREHDARPMTSAVLMGSLAKILPPDVALVEEAVTTTNTTFQRLGALKNTSGYFGHRGWALGWGLGCAIGVKLAWPERPALAVLGEGAALFGIQGLWSAARYRLPVTFVICNNAQYQILKAGARGFKLPNATAERFVGMDLDEPRVDMVGLAQAFGVSAQRVTEPAELSELVAESLQGSVPRLFDVPIQRGLVGPGG